MICSDIITKTELEKCLQNLILSKTDLNYLTTFFNTACDTTGSDYINNIKAYIDNQNKAMYLLYNEYCGLNSIHYDNYPSENFDYYHLRYTFIRDQLSTLLFEKYKNFENIAAQMQIIDNTFTIEEKNLIKLLFNDDTITSFSIKLIRYETIDNSVHVIRHADCEDDAYLNTFSAILNEESVGNITKTEAIAYSALLKNILKKISIGTIH